MKTFSERNPFILGIVGAVVIAGIVMGALNWQKLPFLNPGRDYSAYFADAGGRLALKGWNVIDAQGRLTRVRLGDLQPRSGLSPELFAIHDPRVVR